MNSQQASLVVMPGTKWHLSVVRSHGGAVVFSHLANIGQTEVMAVLTLRRMSVGTRTYQVAVRDHETLPAVVDAIVDAAPEDREACQVE